MEIQHWYSVGTVLVQHDLYRLMAGYTWWGPAMQGTDSDAEHRQRWALRSTYRYELCGTDSRQLCRTQAAMQDTDSYAGGLDSYAGHKTAMIFAGHSQLCRALML